MVELGGDTIASFITGGGVAAILTFMRERGRVRAYTLGVVDASVKTAMESLQGTIGTLQKEIDRINEKHEECQEHLADMRGQIDDLMKGPVANYGDKAPRD